MMERDPNEAYSSSQVRRLPWNFSRLVGESNCYVPSLRCIVLFAGVRLVRVASYYLERNSSMEVHATSFQRTMEVPKEQILSLREQFPGGAPLLFGEIVEKLHLLGVALLLEPLEQPLLLKGKSVISDAECGNFLGKPDNHTRGTAVAKKGFDPR